MVDTLKLKILLLDDEPFMLKVLGAQLANLGLGLGMMLSSAARNELQAVQTIPLILFPSILLTGVFFPLEAIPGGLRVFSYLVPLTYASDALRSVMLRGWGVGEIWVQIVVLFAYAFLALLGAAVFVRRQA